jgi:hypothetical protein
MGTPSGPAGMGGMKPRTIVSAVKTAI